MTVSTTHAYVSYNGNDATVEFPITFAFFFSDEIIAFRVETDGSETALVENVDYTITGGQDSETLPSTGVLEMIAPEVLGVVTPPATGEKIRIERATRLTQARTHTVNDNFPPKTVEGSYDARVLLGQDVWLMGKRALKQSMQAYISGSAAELELPSPTNSSVLGWVDGEVVNYPVADIGGTISPAAIAAALGVSDYILTLLDDTDGSVARATLGSTPIPVTSVSDPNGQSAQNARVPSLNEDWRQHANAHWIVSDDQSIYPVQLQVGGGWNAGEIAKVRVTAANTAFDFTHTVQGGATSTATIASALRAAMLAHSTFVALPMYPQALNVTQAKWDVCPTFPSWPVTASNISTTLTGTLTLTQAQNLLDGPVGLHLQRGLNTTRSPVATDNIEGVHWWAPYDAGGNAARYIKLDGFIVNPASASLEALLNLGTADGSVVDTVNRVGFQKGMFLYNTAGVAASGGDQGAGSINTPDDGGYWCGGAGFLRWSGGSDALQLVSNEAKRVQIGTGGVSIVNIHQSGSSFYPETSGAVDLGKSDRFFRNIYLSGVGYITSGGKELAWGPNALQFGGDGIFDFQYHREGGVRFGGEPASGFSDGAAFQGFGGLHSLFAGQMYFDYGSQDRSIAGRAAFWRSAENASPVTVMALNAAGDLGMASGRLLGWAGSADASAAKDVAFARQATGIFEINNGTTGTLADLSLRTITVASQVVTPELTNITASGVTLRATHASGTFSVFTSNVERGRADQFGNVRLGMGLLTVTATNGYFYIPTCSGTPTGTPSVQTGFAPVVINLTNNKLYFFSNNVWRDAGP